MTDFRAYYLRIGQVVTSLGDRAKNAATWQLLESIKFCLTGKRRLKRGMNALHQCILFYIADGVRRQIKMFNLLDSLDFVMKLFKTNNKDTVDCCRMHFQFDSPSILAQRRTMNFVAKYRACNNLLCKYV